MKNSYLTAGITLKQLFRLLPRNRISFRPKYIFRLFFILQSAFWSSLFSFLEKQRFDRKINSIGKIPGPVFIIGHWRTGTTLLHKLMSLDPRFTAPNLFQVALPDGFLTSQKFYRPVMQMMVSKTRPMDMMKMGLFEPQEDEYAIFRLTSFSPLERLIFPESREYFLLNCTDFVPDGVQGSEWKNSLTYFFKKIYFASGKTVLSKNPFNSMRIKELLEIFPDAKFIHIYRHPFNVIPSTIHMFDIVQDQNCLNKNKVRPSVMEVTTVFNRFMDAIRNDLSMLSPERYCEIKFEEFESDPVRSLKSLYHLLNFNFSDQFELKIISYLSEVKDYKKNEFQLTEDEKNTISGSLIHHMKYYGYL